MDEEIFKKLEEQDTQLKSIYKSVEKTRKYFLWTMIITVVMIVVPLIVLGFVIPIFLNTFTETLGNLGI